MIAAAPQSLHPPMLMPDHTSEDALARLVVNQADDECPHDRTSLLDQDRPYRATVSGWLRASGRIVSSAR
jgi:hypothetical protein